ncbi:hypothetical protein AWB74_04939 [Caballeronia arvi]|uniref:Uncharacterized protein n=1 Tax=Caballeronia arvi TaxID=1777135 RepID=A0A158K6D8_9BURK|nr:hypothetical protein AWB74_04939 [Caballeronia arvi]
MSAKRKQTRLAGELGCFVQKYARKAHAGHDPNDRRYDRKIEKAIRTLRPDELSELLSGDGEIDESPRTVGGTIEIDEYR